MTAQPKAIVIVFPGSNGDRDLHETFQRAGFSSAYLESTAELPPVTQVVGLPGGFSYGDYWRAGVLASRARAVSGLDKHVSRGGLVIGICNGFQILVEAGLLPGGLTYNTPPGFRHRWLEVCTQSARPSPWFADIPAGTVLRMPMAHGEGNYFHPGGDTALTDAVPLVYTQNPNGSMGDVAGLLDATGRILGIMPHPERASDPDLASHDGMRIFAAARRSLA